jgi:acyl-CoA synthetase (AMP-forming)/AMP-acid ligase II
VASRKGAHLLRSRHAAATNWGRLARNRYESQRDNRPGPSRTPDKTALFRGNTTISYRDLDASSTALAQWFLDQGLRPGERVAILCSNSIEVVQLLFALFKAGLVAVAVNVRLKPSEIGYILEHSEAWLCFSEAALALLARQAGARCPIRTELPALGRGERQRQTAHDHSG